MLRFVYNIFRAEISRAGLRSKPSAESWVEPWVSSLTALPNRTKPRPGPKPRQVRRAEPYDKSSRIPSPEPRANPQLSPMLGPELGLSRAPSWAKSSIEPISRFPSRLKPSPSYEPRWAEPQIVNRAEPYWVGPRSLISRASSWAGPWATRDEPRAVERAESPCLEPRNEPESSPTTIWSRSEPSSEPSRA